jgi:hypothetical protein
MLNAHPARLGLMLFSLAATILTAPVAACGSDDQGSAAAMHNTAAARRDVCVAPVSLEPSEDEGAETQVPADPDAGFVAVTVTRDGHFGIGFDDRASKATALAKSHCQARAGENNNCGSQLSVTRGSWILVHRCGDQPLIASSAYLEDTEQEMINAEIAQHLYFGNSAPCRHLVTVDPAGDIARLHGLPATAGATLSAR